MKKHSKYKRGRPTKSEIKQIVQLLPVMSDEEIAQRFGRRIEQIKKIREQYQNFELPEFEKYKKMLHTRFFWKEIKRQLVGEEKKYFEQEWATLMHNFGDTNASDEIILKDLIMIDIHCNRVLKEKRRATIRLKRAENALRSEMLKSPEERNHELISSYTMIINEARSALQQLNKEYTELQSKKDNKFKEMKMTRQERFKKLQESKKNIFQLIDVLNEIKNRQRFGQINAYMKDATEKLREKYTQPQKFPDGTIDPYIIKPEDD